MYIMKLERVLRKAVPFLLIAILIACLFSKPQKEGMKGTYHWLAKDHSKNAAKVAGGAVGTIIAGSGAKLGYDAYKDQQAFLKYLADEDAKKAAKYGSDLKDADKVDP